ncbi:helix-turn-helix domain-containing protein [Mucilaginibacter sp.]
MANKQPYRFKSISEYCRLAFLPAPMHPLMTVIHVKPIKNLPYDEPISVVTDFYIIALKRNFTAKMQYGQQPFDFDEGTMSFLAPGQVYKIALEKGKVLDQSGWMLVVHPDFLWNTPLAKTIKKYEYFDYSVNEALFLSDREEATLNQVVENIQHELLSNTDKFSQDLIIAQLEVLLTYAGRFYHRQFLTRKISSHNMLNQVEELLSDYFNNEDLINKGLPSVSYIADKLNVSANYLGSMLKVLTGQNAQQHIHSKLIDKAKEKLSTTGLSVSEIAYELGFEHSQSFSKLFKRKTNLSPLQFRASFN